MKTFSAKPQDVQREWWVLDLAEQTLGRAATQVATVLRGKHRPTYTPHVDTGDFVIVVNAEKVVLTGNKSTQKTYYRHSGYPGGIYDLTAQEMLEKKPEKVFELAVRGMLPKNSLGRQMLKKLKIYAGPEHPHTAQQPKALEI